MIEWFANKKYLHLKRSANLFGLGLVTALILIPNPAWAAGMIEGFLWNIVNAVFGMAVYFGGQILNFGVNSFVIGFGDFYISRGLGNVVDSMWAIIRDIFNLTFIFGLVFIGLKMIFDSSDSNAKRVLGTLIMAALLVNFSLFFTKTIVDFSNLMAYQVAKNGFPAITAGPGVSPSMVGKVDVSGNFLNITGLTGLWNWNSSSLPAGEGSKYTYIFFTMILYIIMAFVFFAGGILLLIRFAVLNIYLIFSPVMFLGWVLPGASSISSDYWKGFIGRVFFAPAYILMLYFSYRILTGFSATAGGANVRTGPFSDVFKSPPEPGQFETIMAVFGLTAIFMIASIIVAQKMGTVGGSAAVGGLKWMQSKGTSWTKRGAGAATAGTLAYVGRKGLGGTFGRLADEGSDTGRRLRLAAQGTGLKAAAYRATLLAANKAQTASFDPRNVGGLGKSLGIGESKEGGYKARREAYDKKMQERAKLYANNDQAYTDYGVQDEFKEYNDKVKERDETFRKLASEKDKNVRKQLSEKARDLDSQIKAMEKPEKPKPPRDGETDPGILHQYQVNKDRYDQLMNLNSARQAAKANYGQRVYATNLANRHKRIVSNIPIVGQLDDDSRVRKVLEFTFGNLNPFGASNDYRESAAEAINKQAGVKPNDKILEEFFKEQTEKLAAKPDAAPTVAPATPPTTPGSSGGGPSIILDSSGRPFSR